MKLLDAESRAFIIGEGDIVAVISSYLPNNTKVLYSRKIAEVPSEDGKPMMLVAPKIGKISRAECWRKKYMKDFTYTHVTGIALAYDYTAFHIKEMD